MGVPGVSITRAQFATNSGVPSPTGILAIVAPAPQGAQNVAMGFANDGLILEEFGQSPLTEDCSYVLQVVGNPVVAIRPTTATAAAYSAVAHTGMTGSCIPTAGAAVPVDSYPVTVTFTSAATVGSAGSVNWTYSLDDVNTSAVQTTTVTTAPVTLTIPNFPNGASPGVSFSLAAGTINVGDTFSCQTTHALTTDSDLSTSFTALHNYSAPYEAVYFDHVATSNTVAEVDTFLAGEEKVGKAKLAFVNARFLEQGTETTSAFVTAMTTLANGSTRSIRLSLSADGGDITSTLTGLTLPRQTALAVAARSMSIPLGVSPAFVDDGPLTGVVILDSNGNPAFYNEELVGGSLDDLGFTTLRTLFGQQTFVNEGLIFSIAGSDYVFIQHARVSNRAFELCFQALTRILNGGFGKMPPDPTTGAIYIAPSDAARIESGVNLYLNSGPLKNQAQAIRFQLSRTDDIGFEQRKHDHGPTQHGGARLRERAQGRPVLPTKRFGLGLRKQKSWQ